MGLPHREYDRGGNPTYHTKEEDLQCSKVVKLLPHQMHMHISDWAYFWILNMLFSFQFKYDTHWQMHIPPNFLGLPVSWELSPAHTVMVIWTVITVTDLLSVTQTYSNSHENCHLNLQSVMGSVSWIVIGIGRPKWVGRSYLIPSERQESLLFTQLFSKLKMPISFYRRVYEKNTP